MNLSKPLLTGITILCLFASCKKNNSNNGPSGSDSTKSLPKIKMYVEETHAASTNEIDTFYLTYDNDGRLTALTGVNLKFVYTYSGNTGFTLDLFENSALSIHEDLFVKGSYVDSTFQYNAAQDSSTQKYTYNGNLMTSEIDYDYTRLGGGVVFRRQLYSYDGSGNVIKDVEDDGAGRINYTTTYTYTDKPLTFSTSPVYYPLMSKNLQATVKITDNNGNVVGNVSYTYQFDGSGRVTKQTGTEVSYGWTYIKSFTYY